MALGQRRALLLVVLVACIPVAYPLALRWWPAGANLYVGASSAGCVSWAALAWLLLTGAVLLPLSVLVPARAHTAATTEAAWRRALLLFLAANAAWCLAATHRLFVEAGTLGLLDWLEGVGGLVAWPGMWNMAFAVIPVERGPGLLQLLGGSHDAAVHLHTWFGHAAAAWLLLHTVLLTVAYALRYKTLAAWLATMVPTELVYTEATVNFPGWVAMACLGAMWLSSLRAFRRRWFNLFAVLHTLAVPFVLCATLHDYSTFYFALGGALVWVADMVRRRQRRAAFVLRPCSCKATNGSITLSGCGSLARLELPAPPHWPAVHAGQMVYVRAPWLASTEWHPYSIGFADPNAARIVLHVRVAGDWSAKLVDACGTLRGSSSSMPLELEGPYGGLRSLSAFRHCTFLAGGVGITGLSAELADRVEQEQEHGQRQASSTSLVWSVTTEAQLQVYPELLDLLDQTDVPASIHVSRPAATQAQAPRVIPIDAVAAAREPGRLEALAPMLGAYLGALLGHALARVLCCNRPNPAGRGHVCGMLGHEAAPCQGCDAAFFGNQTGPLPCCDMSVCFLCFRGLPVVLAGLLAVLGAVSLAALARVLASRLPTAKESEESERLAMAEQSQPLGCGGKPGLGAKPVAAAVCAGRANLAGILAAAAAHPPPSCVVVCGPPALLHAVAAGCRRHPSLAVIVANG